VRFQTFAPRIEAGHRVWCVGTARGMGSMGKLKVGGCICMICMYVCMYVYICTYVGGGGGKVEPVEMVHVGSGTLRPHTLVVA
jgi:hypothetical protein